VYTPAKTIYLDFFGAAFSVLFFLPPPFDFFGILIISFLNQLLDFYTDLAAVLGKRHC